MSYGVDRNDLSRKRKKLMAAWADYCGKTDTEGAGEIVSLAARKG